MWRKAGEQRGTEGQRAKKAKEALRLHWGYRFQSPTVPSGWVYPVIYLVEIVQLLPLTLVTQIPGYNRLFLTQDRPSHEWVMMKPFVIHREHKGAKLGFTLWWMRTNEESTSVSVGKTDQFVKMYNMAVICGGEWERDRGREREGRGQERRERRENKETRREGCGHRGRQAVLRASPSSRWPSA